MNDVVSLAADLIHSRQTILPKRLIAPGPDAMELDRILKAAASAPDHGQLLPWRFVLVPSEARATLAEAFAQALLERDPSALEDQLAQAREKAFRAPLLLLAIVNGGIGDPDIDLPERIVSAGCAIQNMLLMATAMGFGSALTSGKALKAQGFRQLFGMAAQESALCFISIGTILARKAAKPRPAISRYVSSLATPSCGISVELNQESAH